MRLTALPNCISAFRIALIVPIVFMLVREHYPLALLLILLAGISDGVDGWLARKLDCCSILGGLLDPLADKLLFVSVFAALTWNGLVPAWLFGVVVARDLVIVLGAAAYQWLIEPVRPQPSKVGKLNTVMALLYLLFVITRESFGWPPEVSVLITGAGVLVVSLVSGLDYVMTWTRRALQSGLLPARDARR